MTDITKYVFPKECKTRKCEVYKANQPAKALPKLKVCPFCCAEAKLISDCDEEFWIECSACKAISNIHDEPAAAAKAWNKRVSNGDAQE